MYDVIIKNGKVVSPATTVNTDIAIVGDKIVAIGSFSEDQGKKIIDTDGKYVMPGVIEVHMHCMAPFQGCLGANDFYEQSISAAFGGVTMYMDFANVFPGKSVFDAVKERKEEMKISAIDYSVHGKFVESPPEIIDEIENLIEYGVPTFKMFMTYKKEGVMSDDETLHKIFQKSKELNGLPMVHCESNAIAETNIEKYTEEDNLSWVNYAKIKLNLCETEAFSRAVHFSEYVGNGLLVVHTTNGDAFDIVRVAHKKDLPIYVDYLI